MNIDKALSLFVVVSAWAMCLPAEAKVTVPSIFSDGMVVQRSQPFQVWGHAAVGEMVKVAVDEHSKTVTADANGCWTVSLNPLMVGHPRTVTISGSNIITIKNVQVGDVWICSGQSNMNLPLGASDFSGDPVPANLKDKISCYQVMPNGTGNNYIDAGKWVSMNNQNALALPAIPVLFGRALSAQTHVPTAVILTACDGAPIETFMPPETVKKTHCEKHQFPVGHIIGGNFQSRLAPILHFGVKGLIWYQGESNLFDVTGYKVELPIFIQDIRLRMGSHRLPILLIQLPNFGYKQLDKGPVDSFWADMREAQQLACQLPDVHMVVSIDTARDDASSLHPKEKSIIAERLAAIAAKISAGQKPESLPLVGVPRIEQDFVTIPINSNQKLSVKNGDKLKGFQLAGADHKFYWADAELLENTIKVSCDEVVEPAAVRYAWADNPECNLYAGDNPVQPFRTDSWITKPKLNPAAMPAYQISSVRSH